MPRFAVPGPPVPKARPRVTKTGHAYTPRKSRDYADAAKLIAKAAMHGASPLSGPVAMTVIALMAIPKSWTRKRKSAALAGDLPHTKKPDIDNIAKQALDICNGIVFIDDAQVVSLHTKKAYAEGPCLAVIVDEA